MEMMNRKHEDWIIERRFEGDQSLTFFLCALLKRRFKGGDE